MQVTIVLPFASKKLHSHNKGHWRTKAAAVKSRRREAELAATIEMIKEDFEPAKSASIQYRFFVPDNRPRDTVNMMQAEKATIDGFVDAGLIAGDNWQVLTVEAPVVEIDRKNPRVEFVVTKAS